MDEGFLFVWNCILGVAKSHLPESSPGRGAAGDSVELEAKPVSRASIPYRMVHPASGQLLPSVHCVGPRGCGWGHGAVAVWTNAAREPTPSNRVPRERTANSFVEEIKHLKSSHTCRGHTYSGQ